MGKKSIRPSSKMGERLGTFKYGKLILYLYDTGKVDHRGVPTLAYELYDSKKKIFSGSDFNPSPMHGIDSPQSVGALLGFLSLQPGDTDTEYFENYTQAQLDWAIAHGEELKIVAMHLEEEISDWKDLEFGSWKEA